MQKAKNIELEFVKKEKVSRDAFSFYFKWPGKDFNFIPGQYLKLFLDIKKADARGSSRYFTISSSPYDKENLIITTRIIKSSFKVKLDSLKKGDKISAFGPIGYFEFDPASNIQNVFLAGGIGITPFLSTIRSLEVSNSLNLFIITLFAFFPTKKDLVFYDELKELEKKHKTLEVIYSLTKEVDENFEYGRLSEELLKRNIKNYKEANYFITGSQSMVDSMFEFIKSIDVSEENIFKEDFPGY